MATKKKPAPKKTTTARKIARKTTRKTAPKTARKPAPKAAKKPEKEYGKRPDLGKPIGPFLAKLKSPYKEIVERIRAAVNEAAPRATEAIRWGMPVWTNPGMLCYTAVAKDYVRFGFYHAGIIEGDAQGLEIEGSSKMAHVKLRSVADLRPALFRDWVTKATSLED